MQRAAGLQLSPLASCSTRCELSHKLGSVTSASGPAFRSKPQQRRLRRLTVSAAADAHQQQQQDARRARDVWADAGTRLQNLLSGVGDGETELVSDVLEQQPAQVKLLYAGSAAGIIILGASAVCWLTGNDLFGGASLSPHSLKAAEIGLLAALPMVAAKAWSWTDDARERFPDMDQLQRNRMDDLQPLLASMSLSQAAVAMLFDTVPALLLGLPATLGALHSGYGILVHGLEREFGASYPEALPFALALVTLAAFSVASAQWVSSAEEQHGDEEQVVATALVNADRYYRVMSPEGPEEAARAFKNVAQAWLTQRQNANRLRGYLLAGQLLFLGSLWQLTGDLSAPAVAALSGAAVDTYQMHKRLNRQANASANTDRDRAQ